MTGQASSLKISGDWAGSWMPFGTNENRYERARFPFDLRALVLPTGASAGFGSAPEDLDTNIRRQSEKTAEDLVVAFEQARGWVCERVGHLKIGFDVRSLGPADSQTGYRDPVEKEPEHEPRVPPTGSRGELI